MFRAWFIRVVLGLSMRILTAYITRQFLTAFLVTLLIFLFVMAIGNIFRVIDLFSRGVSGWLILQVFSYGIPFSLIFAIPMSVLAAIFLVFSRMASDHELIALRASGVSLWYVIQAPLLIAAILSLVCVYINCNLAPNSHYARRKVLGKLGVETPLSLLDEGRFIRDFPGFTIYIARKDGFQVEDIVIYEFGKRGLTQTVRAKSGVIETLPNDPAKIKIRLRQARMEQMDEEFPNDLSRVRRLSADEYPIEVDMAELMSRNVVWKKRADLTMLEIFRTLQGNFLFRYGDLQDPDAWARLLGDPPDRLSDFIQAHLAEETVWMLDGYDGTPAWRLAFEGALMNDLNRLLTGPCLYSPDLFRKVRLNDVSRVLLDRRPVGTALIGLNRMLLDDAYPALIKKNALANLGAENILMPRMALMVEVSTRLALSLSCYAFVLLGAALGMKIHRKESSIGMGVALLLVFVFYFFIIIADAMVNHPEFYPHLIVWIPFVVSEIIGFLLIRRN